MELNQLKTLLRVQRDDAKEALTNLGNTAPFGPTRIDEQYEKTLLQIGLETERYDKKEGIYGLIGNLAEDKFNSIVSDYANQFAKMIEPYTSGQYASHMFSAMREEAVSTERKKRSISLADNCVFVCDRDILNLIKNGLSSLSA